MNALVFLMVRRFINSFKRAFNNPGRTVGTLVVLALIVFVYGGPLFFSTRGTSPPLQIAQQLPPLEIIGSVLTLTTFGFLVLSFFSAVSYSRAFTEHDVVTTFPTPLPRKLVFQFLLFTRALLAGIVGTIVIAYLLFRASRSMLSQFPGSIDAGSAALGSATFALTFIVANCALLLLGVLCGMSIFRGFIAKSHFWIALSLALILVVGGLLWKTVSGLAPGLSFLGSLLHRTNEPPFSLLLFPFRAIADSALVAYGGGTSTILAGLILWLILFAVSHSAVMKLSPWMYEYAIRLAEENTRRREMFKHQPVNLKTWIEERKDSRNLKIGSSSWTDRWSPVGAAALFWRNIVLIRRSGNFIVIYVYLILTALFGGGILALRTWKPGIDEQGLIIMGGMLQFILIFAYIPSSISWMTQMLKRFEIQKPLPIDPRRAILAELLPTGIAVAGSTLFALIVLIGLFPHRWSILLLGYCAAASSFLLMTCLLLIVLLFNPDQNDTLQRMLFGIYQLLIFGVGFLPAGVVLLAGFALHVPQVLQGVIVLCTNAAAMYVLVLLAARKYESFNPVD